MTLERYLKNSFTNKVDGINALKSTKPLPFHPYIFLNNRPNPHRLIAMNELHIRGILKENLVSWRNDLAPEIITKSLPNDMVWKIKSMYLEEEESNPGFNKIQSVDFSIPPKIYNDTFISLVGETTTRLTFFTEKTWLPMILRRPGLYINAPGSYKKLTEYGFKLYDEVFDYSFDSEPDEVTRIKLIIDNLERVTHENIREINKILEPKLIFNYNKCISMALNTSLIPKIVIEYIEKIKSMPLTELRPFELNLLNTYDFMVTEQSHLNEYIIT
jgi:hypothetical protein